MNTPKHTPGPWAWPCLYNVDYAIEQAEGRDK